MSGVSTRVTRSAAIAVPARGRGWLLWTTLLAGLALAPVNAFLILLWLWAATHHATEVATENTIAVIALCVLATVCVGAIVAMVRRWGQAVVALSLLQLLPLVLVYLPFAVSLL